MKLALAVLLLACVATRPAPLSNRASAPAPTIRVELHRARGEFACSTFHYWPITFGGCWWVR